MQAIKLIFSSEFTSYLKELNVTCSLVQVLCFCLASTDSLNKLTCMTGWLKSLSLWLYRIV